LVARTRPLAAPCPVLTCMDDLRLDEGVWVAEREGVRVEAACGQEALLRLSVELVRRKAAVAYTGLLVQEHVAPE
jgi:hypothetical protein